MHKQYLPVFSALFLTCWTFRNPTEIYGSCMLSAPLERKRSVSGTFLMDGHVCAWFTVGTLNAFWCRFLTNEWVGSTKQEKKIRRKKNAFAKGTSFIISDMKISVYTYHYSHVNSTSKPVVPGQYCSVYQWVPKFKKKKKNMRKKEKD